ncbi:hypothetical protein SK128_026481 [Halocaridina rubra]|uniref:Uncharacterized protein n=1 Tax=Halocaridina rubra TaxID=373956 RepID=A0AAN8XTN1_HALRR
MQPLLFNTLQVRSALGSSHRRKLSFKNVSNVVVQLLHSIKYSMEVPFSNMAIPPQDKSTSITKKCEMYAFIHNSLSKINKSAASVKSNMVIQGPRLRCGRMLNSEGDRPMSKPNMGC